MPTFLELEAARQDALAAKQAAFDSGILAHQRVIMHPRDFGAAWDGETDDTAAVSAWIAYMKRAGLPVRMPPGRVYCAGTLNIDGAFSTAPGCYLVTNGNPIFRIGGAS